MTKNNKLNILISLLIALCGWIYVMYSLDPSTTKTFRDVSIQYTNEDSLEARGIALKSANHSKINVTVKGKRSKISKLEADEIKVRADLSDAGTGENTLSLQIKTPSDISVVSQSDSNVTVNLEEIDSKAVHGRVEYEEDSTTNTEPILDGSDSELFYVKGAKSLVSKVKYVQIPVDESKISSKEKTFNVTLHAVDSSGDIVSHVTVSPSKASVTVTKGVTKEVPLKLSVNNPENDQYKRTYKGPDTVTIKGAQKAVDEVDSITADEIDLTNLENSGTIPIHCTLPDGISLGNDSLELALTVNVAEYKTKTISFDVSDISIVNANSKYKTSISGKNITLEVMDTGNELKNLTSEAFQVSVNVNGLKTGTYQLKPKVSSKEELHKISVSGKTLEVTITKK